MHDRELTISASAFKAQCLDIMSRIASHKLSRVTVTKRGKPVAVMGPPPAEPAPEATGESVGYPEWWGCMRDFPLLPPGFDWDKWEMPEPDTDDLLEQLGARNPFA